MALYFSHEFTEKHEQTRMNHVSFDLYEQCNEIYKNFTIFVLEKKTFLDF